MKRKNKLHRYVNVIKGRGFELVLQKLLKKAGFNFNIISNQIISYKKNRIRGRSSTYDSDFIAEFPIVIPFSYPSLLIGEAKYHKRILEVKEARAFLGAFIDISQFAAINTRSKLFKYSQIFLHKRYNYIPVIFSKSGFRKNAQALMWAHGIYFVSYENSPVLDDINIKLDNLIKKINFEKLKKEDIKQLTDLENFKDLNPNSKKGGFSLALKSLFDVINPTNSYFGLLDGIWPIHFLYKGKREIKPCLKNRECICKVKDNLVTVKRTLNKNSRNLGNFVLPKYFLEEYRKMSKNKKILQEILLYIPKDGKIFPYYIKLYPEAKHNF